MKSQSLDVVDRVLGMKWPPPLSIYNPVYLRVSLEYSSPGLWFVFSSLTSQDKRLISDTLPPLHDLTLIYFPLHHLTHFEIRCLFWALTHYLYSHQTLSSWEQGLCLLLYVRWCHYYFYCYYYYSPQDSPGQAQCLAHTRNSISPW